MRIALYIAVVGILITAPAARAEKVPVEVATGVTMNLQYPSPPGFPEIAQDQPGHYVFTGRTIPMPVLTPATTTPASTTPVAFAEPAFEGQQPVPARIAAVVALAKSFWSARLDTARTCPEDVRGYVASNLDNGAIGRGWHAPRPDGTTACDFWVAGSLVARLTSKRRTEAAHSRRVNACTEMTHELGHAYGLQHRPSGVMAGLPQGSPPFFCRQWARTANRS